MIEIDYTDFSLLMRRVKDVDPALSESLSKRLNDIAKPIADEVKQAALGLSSKGAAVSKYRVKRGSGGGGASLRQGLAYAVEVKQQRTRPGAYNVRVRVSGTKFRTATGKPATLPRYIEGLSRRGWRHPVFVSKDRLPGPPGSWVSQSSKPFLLRTVMPHKPEAIEATRRAFLDALSAAGITD